jgi:hypothetical protein
VPSTLNIGQQTTDSEQPGEVNPISETRQMTTNSI